MAQYLNQQVGNYRLIQLLGTGGFGTVYLGEHIYLGTQAAIKVVNGELSDQQRQTFITEARTIARLVHPHIVRVLEFGVEGNLPFLVMDYAPHGSLKDRHPDGGQIAWPTIVSYVKQIADALQYTHDKKLIHRDIKPENLLVGERNEVLLSDFGIVVIAHSTRSQRTEDVIGTWSYMAPEQFAGKPQPATDQYALGVLVYQWLCGSPPFQGSSGEIYHQHLNSPPPPMRAKLSTIPPAIEQAVLKALAKQPAQRFPSVQDFAQTLEQANQPYHPTIIAPPPQKAQQGGILGTPLAAATNPPHSPLSPTILATNVKQAAPHQTNMSSPPLITENPTEEQIYQAMISKTNPYAQWGKLVLDDDAKKIWGNFKRTWVHHYQGDFYKIEPDGLSFAHFYQRMLKKFDITDFVYQVQVSVADGERGTIGLVFRADQKNNMYYALKRSYTDKTLNGYADAVIQYGEDKKSYFEDGVNFPVTKEAILELQEQRRMQTVRKLFNEGQVKEAMEMEEEINIGSRRPARKIASPPLKTSCLLAVVAQGITFDFYVDCQFFKRVSSNTISHGTVGLFASGSITALYSHAKVWVK